MTEIQQLSEIISGLKSLELEVPIEIKLKNQLWKAKKELSSNKVKLQQNKLKKFQLIDILESTDDQGFTAERVNIWRRIAVLEQRIAHQKTRIEQLRSRIKYIRKLRLSIKPQQIRE